MAYKKTVWKNAIFERARTFKKQDNADGTLTLIPAFGQVIQEGTKVEEKVMNNIEGGIESVEKSLDDFILTKGKVNGFASLDGTGKVPKVELPEMGGGYEKIGSLSLRGKTQFEFTNIPTNYLKLLLIGEDLSHPHDGNVLPLTLTINNNGEGVYKYKDDIILGGSTSYTGDVKFPLTKLRYQPPFKGSFVFEISGGCKPIGNSSIVKKVECVSHSSDSDETHGRYMAGLFRGNGPVTSIQSLPISGLTLDGTVTLWGLK